MCLSGLAWYVCKKKRESIRLMDISFPHRWTWNLEPVGIYIPFQLNYIPRRFDYVGNGMTVGNDFTMKEWRGAFHGNVLHAEDNDYGGSYTGIFTMR